MHKAIALIAAICSVSGKQMVADEIYGDQAPDMKSFGYTYNL